MPKLNFQGVFQGPGEKLKIQEFSRISRSSANPVKIARKSNEPWKDA